MTADLTDLTDLLGLAVEAARTGGDELLARYARPSGIDTKSASGDFVSDADRASEQAITELLAAARPDDGLLGEEGTDRDAPSGLRWVVDPLDGTSNYLYGFGAWTVSVAAQRYDGRRWRSVVGAVFDPLTGEVFQAAHGLGASLGGQQLRVNDPVALDRALIGTGFGYDRDVRARQGRVTAHVLTRVRDIRRAGSAARDLCYVAAGRLDGFYESSLGIWDIAAGALIAREAGAVVTAYGTGVVTAGPALHGPLLDLVTEADVAD